jgi:hypothetical protein
MSTTEDTQPSEPQWWAPPDRAHADTPVEVSTVRFTAEDCDAILLAAKARTPVEVREDADDERRVRSHLWDLSHAWEPDRPDPMDDAAVLVCDRLLAAIRQINTEHFGFDIECLAYVRLYEYAVGDRIGWHADRTDRPYLKLSASVLLSDPRGLVGGMLECHHDGLAYPIPAERGQIVVFPAWVTHRVSPVIRGCRYSLIALAAGPPFR